MFEIVLNRDGFFRYDEFFGVCCPIYIKCGSITFPENKAVDEAQFILNSWTSDLLGVDTKGPIHFGLKFDFTANGCSFDVCGTGPAELTTKCLKGKELKYTFQCSYVDWLHAVSNGLRLLNEVMLEKRKYYGKHFTELIDNAMRSNQSLADELETRIKSLE